MACGPDGGADLKRYFSSKYDELDSAIYLRIVCMTFSCALCDEMVLPGECKGQLNSKSKPIVQPKMIY